MIARRCRVFLGAAGLACGITLSACWLVASLGDVPTKSTVSNAGDGGAVGPSLCDASAFAFCDGFENGLGAWMQATAGGGTITVDAQHVYRGKYALHTTLPTVTSNETFEAYVVHGQPWPQPVFMRFFAYVSPASTHNSPLALLLVNDPPPALSGVSLFANGMSGRLGLAAFGQAGNGNSDAGPPLTPEQWVCLELEASGTEALVWVDGAEDPAETLPLLLSTASVLASLGLKYSPAAVEGDGPYDAWLDEFAVDSQRIYCER